ncbi:MAG: hypothetical protein QM811_00915 [Pirellulales bacterium]
MSHPRPSVIVRFLPLAYLAVLVGGCLAVRMFWHPFGEASRYQPPPFATAADARKTLTMPLPDEATNIRFAGYHEWIAMDEILRFDAPIDVCINHAIELYPNERFEVVSDEDLRRVLPPSASELPDSGWFDLANATDVVTIGSHAAPHGRVWVDRARGVFYSQRTD